MGLFIEIIKWFLVIQIGFDLIDIVYRAITQNDQYRTWDEVIVGDVVSIIICLILLIGLILGW